MCDLSILSGKFLQEINMGYINFAWKVKEKEEDPELYIQIKACFFHERWECYGTLEGF